YPLVSLDIVAHEMSHGFTEQHSRLISYGQSWGINESFSDIAGQAVNYYVKGDTNWQVGTEVLKTPDQAVRYLDEPTKDCAEQKPGYYCSINHIKDFRPKMHGQFSSGIFNKAMYILATSPGWDLRKIFHIMVHANMFYWRSTSGFQEAACGIKYSAQAYRYDTDEVKAAFAQVGIDTTTCNTN
ncbi:MAG: M4 family metallopeptidase, partial [bacterium]|nr:M4 family metallopeptidase [bacterium]